MKRFARLYEELDRTTRTGERIAALERYFRAAPAEDAAWAVHFLSGGRPKRLLPPGRLREWAAEAAGIPGWLFEESHQAVGDLAETIGLLLPPPHTGGDLPLHRWVEDRLLPLRGEEEEIQRRELVRAWNELGRVERFVWNKLITGAFRVGVSQRLVIRALARVGEVDEAAIAHRLMGGWSPTPEAFRALLGSDTRDTDLSRPYPFYLAHPLDRELDSLGHAGEWQAEWKWDGIRAQLVRRGSEVHLWSRGEELITDRFPEIAEAAALLPDGVVLDGELIGWAEDAPLPFAQLQRRIGRKRPGPKIQREVPVSLIVYDLLELGGEDLRARPLSERRAALERLLASGGFGGRFLPSPVIVDDGWDSVREAYSAARERGAEGLMLKRRTSAYGVGRRRGDWWKWKVAPLTADAVLLYAQRGSGRRASLYTDYTFGVWDQGALVPFAKAYSGLTDAEIRKVDAWVRRNTVERFGPVRSVSPALVFEIAFEGIQPSPRHRSGVAVRFPRILRWRVEKSPEEADSLESLRALMEAR